MECGIDHKVPDSKGTLVTIGKDLVGVLRLIGDHLVELAAFELHLLLVELVLDHILTALLTAGSLLVSFLLIVDLTHRD